MILFLAITTFTAFQVLDEEGYLHDGMPYPTPVNNLLRGGSDRKTIETKSDDREHSVLRDGSDPKTVETKSDGREHSVLGDGSDPKTVETKSDDREHSVLGDGCYHIFIDAGSNRGVHGRFLFEPEKYPKSKFAKKFDEIYGNNRTKKKFASLPLNPTRCTILPKWQYKRPTKRWVGVIITCHMG